MKRFRLAAILLVAPAFAQPGPSGVPENSVTRVSDHVSAILGFPNIAIVIGSRGTLLVDTGMGLPNGTIVVREANRLSKNPLLYLTTTHYHPEHSSGEAAFPAGTILMRAAAQQAELNQHGMEYVDNFRRMSAAWRDQLAGVTYRKPDIVFDRELTLDLGGVTARLLWFGPGHTQGDEFVFVEPDGVLVSGDIVQNNLVPNMPNADATITGWLALLDQIDTLKPRLIVPDHGKLGDGSLVAQERALLIELRTRALALKAEGLSSKDDAARLTEEMKAKHPDLGGLNSIQNFVARAYAEAR